MHNLLLYLTLVNWHYACNSYIAGNDAGNKGEDMRVASYEWRGWVVELSGQNGDYVTRIVRPGNITTTIKDIDIVSAMNSFNGVLAFIEGVK
jgi:hypothetical protein